MSFGLRKIRRKYASLIKKCNELILCNQDSVDAHFCLTRVYRRTEEYELALRHGRKVLRINPCELNANLNLGLIFECVGKFKNAISCYKKELALNPSSRETHYNLGYLYFNKRQWKRASNHLEKCFSLNLQFREEQMVYDLSRCYIKRNDLPRYIWLYRKYVKRQPMKGWAAANLAGALLDARRFKESLVAVEAAERLGSSCAFKPKLLKALRST